MEKSSRSPTLISFSRVYMYVCICGRLVPLTRVFEASKRMKWIFIEFDVSLFFRWSAEKIYLWKELKFSSESKKWGRKVDIASKKGQNSISSWTSTRRRRDGVLHERREGGSEKMKRVSESIRSREFGCQIAYKDPKVSVQLCQMCDEQSFSIELIFRSLIRVIFSPFLLPVIRWYVDGNVQTCELTASKLQCTMKIICKFVRCRRRRRKQMLWMAFYYTTHTLFRHPNWALFFAHKDKFERVCLVTRQSTIRFEMGGWNVDDEDFCYCHFVCVPSSTAAVQFRFHLFLPHND